jgi:diguanylate cyclase (GGDEF)-like protein
VRQLVHNRSLQFQIVALGVAGILLTASATLFATLSKASEDFTPRLTTGLVVGGLLAIALIIAASSRLLRPIRLLQDAVKHAHSEQAASKHILDERTKTVDRLLDFSLTIQGVGKTEQVFATLTHYLRTELGLAGIVVLAHDAQESPQTQVKASWPENLLCPDRPVSEIDGGVCPCLRQSLPRQFKNDGCPVRCGLDQSISLNASHPAFCIPFNIGRKVQVLVHMILPADQAWTEPRRQLAQTYCNTASTTLMSLHLLAEAEKQSLTDALTGLFNRRSLEQLMQREVALSERHGHPLSVVMIDMDKFKEVNDAHGHAAGDYLLKSFADCVRITLRKTDLAFRYGGDEFLIALPQTPLAQAQQVVAKIRQAFAAVDFSDGIANLEHQPTLSIGVAERSKAMNLLTLQSLLGAADSALYEAKANDRDCIKIYQPPQAA